LKGQRRNAAIRRHDRDVAILTAILKSGDVYAEARRWEADCKAAETEQLRRVEEEQLRCVAEEERAKHERARRMAETLKKPEDMRQEMMRKRRAEQDALMEIRVAQEKEMRAREEAAMRRSILQEFEARENALAAREKALEAREKEFAALTNSDLGVALRLQAEFDRE